MISPSSLTRCLNIINVTSRSYSGRETGRVWLTSAMFYLLYWQIVNVKTRSICHLIYTYCLLSIHLAFAFNQLLFGNKVSLSMRKSVSLPAKAAHATVSSDMVFFRIRRLCYHNMEHDYFRERYWVSYRILYHSNSPINLWPRSVSCS